MKSCGPIPRRSQQRSTRFWRQLERIEPRQPPDGSGVVHDQLADKAEDRDDQQNLQCFLHRSESTAMMPLIAHGSGVDDVLWFLVPVVVAMFVLRRVEKRAARKASRESESADGN